MKEEQLNQLELEETNLIHYLTTDSMDEFRATFMELHPYEQSTFFEKVEPELRQKIFHYLSPKEMAELFEATKFDEELYEFYLNEMETTYAADMLSYMYADNAADVLNELEADQAASYLSIMDTESAQEIKELLHYEEYTAGSIMTTEYVAIPENSTCRSAMNILRNEAPDAETIYYLFVVDNEHRLSGVISLRDLIVADEDTLIREVMSDRVVSVPVSEDQEAVARMIRDYDFLAVPVIDHNQKLLGIVTVDDIIDVMEEEASDDYSKLAAVSDMDTFDKGPLQAAKKRLPWLVILLFLGILTANVMSIFEKTLDQVALLAVFIPLIAGMAGNSGTQALAVAVRGIASGDIEEESKLKLLFREAGTGLITGFVCGLLVVGIVFVWKHDLIVGALVGAAIFGSIFVATLGGSFIPLLIHRLKIDPAVASGPFITTINDLVSILIYLGLATLFLSSL